MGGSYSTVEVKDVDTRSFSPRRAREVGDTVSPADVVIFNCGFREMIHGFGSDPHPDATLTLRAEGYKVHARSMTCYVCPSSPSALFS